LIVQIQKDEIPGEEEVPSEPTSVLFNINI